MENSHLHIFSCQLIYSTSGRFANKYTLVMVLMKATELKWDTFPYKDLRVKPMESYMIAGIGCHGVSTDMTP